MDVAFVALIGVCCSVQCCRPPIAPSRSTPSWAGVAFVNVVVTVVGGAGVQNPQEAYAREHGGTCQWYTCQWCTCSQNGSGSAPLSSGHQMQCKCVRQEQTMLHKQIHNRQRRPTWQVCLIYSWIPKPSHHPDVAHTRHSPAHNHVTAWPRPIADRHRSVTRAPMPARNAGGTKNGAHMGCPGTGIVYERASCIAQWGQE